MNKLSNKEMEVRVAEYRKLYPTNVLFFTEDGNCFLDKSPCADYANKTKQKWSENSPAVLKVVKTEGKTKEEATAKLMELELSDSTDYPLAKELVAVLELETTSNKKDDLLMALEEFKETLKKAE